MVAWIRIQKEKLGFFKTTLHLTVSIFLLFYFFLNIECLGNGKISKARTFLCHNTMFIPFEGIGAVLLGRYVGTQR